MIDEHKISIWIPNPGGHNGVPKDYFSTDCITLYTDSLANGITPTAEERDDERCSCSFSGDIHGITQRAIHELLHQEYLGHLQHVGLYSGDEIDNIMYKNGTRKNTKLRYRDLPTPDQNDVKQVQWDLIQK